MSIKEHDSPDNAKTRYYKYRPLYQIGEKGEREPHLLTKAIFDKAEIYYAKPKNFNDPYDCNLKLHVKDSTDEEWEKHCDKMSAIYPSERSQMEVIKSRTGAGVRR